MIRRPGVAAVRDHESERQVADIVADRVIKNYTTLEDLWKLVNDVMWDRSLA